MMGLVQTGKLARRLGWTSALAIGLWGCGAAEPEEPARNARAVSELTPELEPVVTSNNAFAWSLYQAAAGTAGNLFFSPFSISAAFGMTYAGAGGDTASEMKEALKIGDVSYHAPFGELMRDLSGEQRPPRRPLVSRVLPRHCRST